MIKESDFIPVFEADKLPQKGEYSWQSPSNIALVKYWGKEDPQIPKNTSVSFTLNQCHTKTILAFQLKDDKQDNFDVEVYLNNQKQDDFKPKIIKFFERIHKYLPFLKSYAFKVYTENSFPHSSGIASSASGMSALALCLMSIEKEMNSNLSEAYFNKKASFLARLGSGSAARSIEGEIVVWGKHESIKDSSNLFGVKLEERIHPNFKNYQDTILLVDKGVKTVSSTVGHNLMNNHPFAERRFVQANENISQIQEIFKTGNLDQFVDLVESEALTLHAMMMTSMPYFILMKPNTLKIIEKVWNFRKNSKTHLCFTLDAGANVHLLYPEKDKTVVLKFIEDELIQFCEKNQYICDCVGLGAKQL